MKSFFRNIIIVAFALYAGITSGIGTSVLLEDKFEGLGIIVGLIVIACAGNGFKELLESIDKKDEKTGK